MEPRIDDPSIADGEPLWRRIIPDWVTRMPGAGVRPSSAAFLDGYTGEVSVHLAALTTQDKILENRPADSLVEILAAFPRSLGHAIVRDPTEDDPAHALICPPVTKSKKLRKADARKMAEQARWIIFRDLSLPPA